MKSKGLLVACVLLLVLGGVMWWSNKREASANKTPVETASVKLLNIPEDQFQEIQIKKRNGEPIDVKRVGGQWQIATATPLRADPDSVSSLLSTLSSLSSDRTVEEKATDLSPYGLTQPALEVDITEKNAHMRKLLVGDDTPAGTAFYAALVGDPRVYALASYKKSSLDKSLNDLRDKRLLTFDSDKLSRIELTAKKQTIEFGRSKDQWQILKPKPLRADQFPVQDLIRSLRDAKMDLTSTDDEKKIATAFNSGAVVADAKVTDVSGTQELQVRKNKDDYYAKSSAVAGVYRVMSSVGTSLDKNVNDFRNKKLFDFGFAEPDKIEIHDGAKSYSLSHSGSDWWSNGTKMDESSVSSLVSAIRELTASKFADSGFTTPVMDLMVTADSGKGAEKVLISKNGDRYLARRENDPALYELAASSVTDLQNYVAAVKPAAPAAPAKK